MKVDIFQPERMVVRSRMRSHLDEKQVQELMKSIDHIGLTELPCVRWEKDEDGEDQAVLVVGWHRVEALRRLGEEWIHCRIFEGDEIEARKWEIAENLHRAELTGDERDEHIREWYRLTETEDKMAAGGHFSENAKVGAGRGNEGGLREFTRELNLPRTTVQEALDLGKLDPVAKEKADAAGLTRKERLTVVRTAKDDPDLQQAKVQEFAAHKAEAATRKVESTTRKSKPVPSPRGPRNDIEAINKEVDRLMTAWRAASDEARQLFLKRIE